MYLLYNDIETHKTKQHHRQPGCCRIKSFGCWSAADKRKYLSETLSGSKPDAEKLIACVQFCCRAIPDWAITPPTKKQNLSKLIAFDLVASIATSLYVENVGCPGPAHALQVDGKS